MSFEILAHARQSSSSSSMIIFSYVTVMKQMKQIFGQPQVLSKKERQNFEIYDFTNCASTIMY
jgi:hypothetical protein